MPPFSEQPWPPLRNAIVSVLRQHRPHTVYGYAEIDVTSALEAISRCQRAARMGVSLHAFVLYCLSRAADEHAAIRTYRFSRKLITFHEVDIGTLIERPVPGHGRLPVQHIVRAANRKSLAAINWELRQVAKSDPTKDANVRLRRRVASLPGFVRRLISWRIARNPFWLKHFHGTLGLTSVHQRGFERPLFALPPNIFTLTLAVGGLTDRFVPGADGQPVLRRMLCLSAGADHAILDGMTLSRFARRLSELLESAAGLDDAFVDETLRFRGDPRR
jgi:pyruvate/2-oxoglutarate dehydrogenase complex dihydrolipoamide acyltransferase (E2) component